MKPGEISASTSVAGVDALNTGVDRGEDFLWAAGIVSGNAMRQFVRQFAPGVTLAHRY
jgi:hypothetical protein